MLPPCGEQTITLQVQYIISVLKNLGFLENIVLAIKFIPTLAYNVSHLINTYGEE
jgi:hypothetical protein